MFNNIPQNKITDNYLIELLTNVLNKSISREEIYFWQEQLQQINIYTYLTESKCGNFVLHSLAFIKDKELYVSNDVEEKYFIRDSDIHEYISCLKKIDCKNSYGKLKRLRHHQIPVNQRVGDYYLLSLNANKGKLLSQFGVFFLRGMFDDMALHQELALVNYEDAMFVIEYIHRYYPYSGSDVIMISGFPGSNQELINMLLEINIKPDEIEHFHEDYFIMQSYLTST